MQSKKSDSSATEESPVEADITVSLKEYQMLRHAVMNRDHGEKWRKKASRGTNPDEMRAKELNCHTIQKASGISHISKIKKLRRST